MLITSQDILNVLGEKIKEARSAKKLTQEALAEKIDISKDLLRNIENGRNIGSLATLLNLCNALDITPDYLFYDLLDNTNSTHLDSKLYNYIRQFSKEDKKLLKDIIIHIDKNY